MRTKAIAICGLFLILQGCKDTGKDQIRIVMENKTGQHMTLFKLYYGGGVASYEIFSRDYTFAEMADPVSAPRELSVEFFDESGKKIECMIDYQLLPGMKGGRLFITFLPEGKHKAEYTYP